MLDHVKRHLVRALFISFLAAQLAIADEAADKLLKEGVERAKTLRTLSARIELTRGSPGQLKGNSGTITLMKPNLALVQLSGDYPLVTLASDGRSRYLFPEANKYSLAAADATGKNIDTPWWAFPVRFFFTQDVRPFGPDSPPWTSSRHAGTKTIGGETYDVLEIAGDKPMPYVAHFYFDRNKLLRRSVVTFGEGERATAFTAQIEDVNTTRRLRTSNFRFKPPATARLDTGAEAKMLAIGDRGPDFSLPTPEGNSLKLESAQGKKATLINFWYLSCPPCRAEFELFQKLYSELKDQGFSIVAINTVDAAADIKSYVRETRLTFPIVMKDDSVLGAYRIETYPSTYLLDAEGKIVYRAVGVDEAGLLKALRELGFKRPENKPKG